MYAFATWLGGNRYDVVIWDSEEDSVNDDGMKAIARRTVTVDENDIAGSIQDAMGLSDTDDVEVN